MARTTGDMRRFLILVSGILVLLIVVIIGFSTIDALNTLNESQEKAEDEVVNEVVGVGTLSTSQLLPGGTAGSPSVDYLNLQFFMEYVAGDPSGVYGFLLDFLGPVYGVMAGTISADGDVLASSLPPGINPEDLPPAEGGDNHYRVVDRLGSQQGHFIVWYIPWISPVPGTNQMPVLTWVIDRTEQINQIASNYDHDRNSLLIRQISIGIGALLVTLIIVLFGIRLLSKKYISGPMSRMQGKLLRAERLGVLGEMAGSVSHEMRNPLNVIKSSAFYLRGRLGDTDEKVVEHLDKMDRSVQRADNIINDLLSYSKIATTNPQQTDAITLVRTILSEMHVPDGIDVVINAPDNLRAIWIDPSLFGQVLNNLLLNSFQAMPDGGKVEVGLAAEEGAFKATVRDDGIGIPAKNLPKVFEPLFSTKAVGTGFGLAVCRRIVEEQGGSIDIESEEGKGTLVTVRLPEKRGQ